MNQKPAAKAIVLAIFKLNFFLLKIKNLSLHISSIFKFSNFQIFKLAPSQILKATFSIITLANQQIRKFAASIFKFSNFQIFKLATFLIITSAHQHIITFASSIFKFSNFQIFKFSFLFIVLANQQISTSAQDSSHIRVSLITCGPGEPDDELYTTFGHTGIRIIDSSSVTDYVYNYGTFDAFEDNFYINFIKGRLRYYVQAENFNEFAENYKISNRSITEQVLNIAASEKIAIQNFLNNNILIANRYYKYDFCFDNCTTRVRDIIKKNHDSSFIKNPVMPAGTTFRNAIHVCLNRNDQQWSKLGIDILLGKPCDAIMTTEQMDFLPENLMNSLNETKPPFASPENKIFTAVSNIYQQSFFSPTVVFSILLIAIVALSFSPNQKVQQFLQGFDRIFFFTIGLLGILLFFMWVATDHLMTKSNFNLLWAWPTHAVIAFFATAKKNWVKKYFIITAIGIVLVLCSWFFLPQQMNNALLPVILLLFYRSIRRYQAF